MRTLLSRIAISHVLTTAWSLLSTVAHADCGGWAMTAAQVLGSGIVGLLAVVLATILTPLPAVMSLPTTSETT
jgi:threonine dehydrogenase-like Zn-dependent dehydrogenase